MMAIFSPRAPGRGHARPRGGADVKDQRQKMPVQMPLLARLINNFDRKCHCALGSYVIATQITGIIID